MTAGYLIGLAEAGRTVMIPAPSQDAADQLVEHLEGTAAVLGVQTVHGFNWMTAGDGRIEIMVPKDVNDQAPLGDPGNTLVEGSLLADLLEEADYPL